MTIGDRVMSARLRKGMTQDELARKAGYKSRSSINKIELGQRSLTHSKIKAVAHALGTTPQYIMGWNDEGENMSSTGIGIRIKNMRETLGITQTELANLVGESKQTIYKYEKGIVENIPFTKLRCIAKALDVSADYLMFGAAADRASGISGQIAMPDIGAFQKGERELDELDELDRQADEQLERMREIDAILFAGGDEARRKLLWDVLDYFAEKYGGKNERTESV